MSLKYIKSICYDLNGQKLYVYVCQTQHGTSRCQVTLISHLTKEEEDDKTYYAIK